MLTSNTTLFTGSKLYGYSNLRALDSNYIKESLLVL